MSTETDKNLQEMHTLVAKVILNGLKSDDEKMRLRSADQARKFLKDNSIQSHSAGLTDIEKELEDMDLPTFDDTEALIESAKRNGGSALLS